LSGLLAFPLLNFNMKFMQEAMEDRRKDDPTLVINASPL